MTRELPGISITSEGRKQKEPLNKGLFLVLRTGLEPVTYGLEIPGLFSYIRAERVSVAKKSPF